VAYEQRDNSGTIFVNDRKEKETHPDRSGTAMIDGVMYYVSGWIKEGAKGKFLSLAFKKKEGQSYVVPAIDVSSKAKATFTPRHNPNITSGLQKQNIMPDDDMSDEIPF
jgi:hypothetical protein